MSRRDQIVMNADEQQELLENERVAIVTTNGVRGWPHSMPLWYVVIDGEVWAWTFAKSQKVKNLERDGRATVLVETGHDYSELKGVQIEAETELIRDIDRVLEFARKLIGRYAGGLATGPEGEEVLRAQAPKRVVLRFKPVRVASWDHSKLGGVY